MKTIIKISQNIIYTFVVLFCFIFFPLYLLYVISDVYYDTKIETIKQNKLKEMTDSLQFVNKYSNNKRYFHFLFNKISEFAQNSDKPVDYIKANFDNLKKKYPNKFQFVVWNEKGKIIKELSDKNDYSYILNKLHDNLNEVTKAVRLDSSVHISSLESIKKNLKLFQSILGRLFIAENLKFPILNDISAGPFLTDLSNDYPYVWFSIKPKISFLCFISSELLEDLSGLNKIINHLNDSNKIIYGYSTPPNYEKPVTNFPEPLVPYIITALSIFENLGDTIFENDKVLIKISMPQPNIRTFCLLTKTDNIWNYDYQKKILFYTISSFLLLFYSFIGFWFIYKKHFFSINYKLAILFLFANLIPISTLAIVTNKYLSNKKISLNNEAIANLEKSIRNLDDQYNDFTENYFIQLNSLVENVANKIGNNTIKEPEINQINSFYDKFECSYLYLIASDSEVISNKQENPKAQYILDFMTKLSKAVLDFLNNKAKKEKQKNLLLTMSDPSHSNFVRSYLKNIGKKGDLIVGDMTRIYYSNIIGDSPNFNNNYFLLLMWEKEKYENIFLRKNFNNIYNNNLNAEFYIKSNYSNTYYGSKKLEKYLFSILENNAGKNENITGNLIIDNKKYIYISLKGMNLKDWSFIGIYPEDEITKKINLLIFQLFSGAFISLLFTIIIGKMLSLQFLKPINNLKEATLAIGEHNFSHRIPIVDKDEFGYLSQTYNNVIEGLGDLEVGKIVQGSLFPGNSFKTENIDIFGKSVVVTTLGGDYYDCFKINDEYQGIIIGDVAGHGIPAGLMMAMAKSAVLSAPEEIKLDPTALTSRLHKVFFSIKNEKLRRMMTFQYFIYRIKDGHFTYTNAGHPYPIIVDSNSQTAKYLSYVSTPLGICPKCGCTNKEFVLEKGQSLVLCTDGIIEATNSKGEQYGFNRLIDCLPKYYDKNPEIYYSNLYNKVYMNWINKPNDDLTLIIVNRT